MALWGCEEDAIYPLMALVGRRRGRERIEVGELNEGNGLGIEAILVPP
jgi:hypothetical protein